MKKRTSIIVGIVALILDQLTKMLFINKNMELIPNVLKIYYWQNEGTIFEIAKGIKLSLIAMESIIIIIADINNNLFLFFVTLVFFSYL